MAKKKILIIDFDQKSLASLHKTLSEEGYQVALAADGKAGWQKFLDETPDLVLIEPMLSRLHGFELCQKITSCRDHKPPVFIMTGVYKDYIYKSEGLRTYGASEYFEKPLNMPEFLAAVRRVLPHPRAEQRTETAPQEFEPEAPIATPVAKGIKKGKKPEIPSLEALKSMVTETSPTNGREASPRSPAKGEAAKDDIDKILEMALSDLGFIPENKRTEKTLPPPPRKAATLEAVQKARPKPPPPAPPKPPAEEKTAAAPPPAKNPGSGSVPTPSVKTAKTTPGGESAPLPPPGSSKPQGLGKRLIFGPPPMSPSSASPAPSQSAAAEKPKMQTRPEDPPREIKARPAPPGTAPKPPLIEKRQITESRALFTDLEEPEKKPLLPKVIAAGIVLVLIAVAGYIVLKPKKSPARARVETNIPYVPPKPPSVQTRIEEGNGSEPEQKPGLRAEQPEEKPQSAVEKPEPTGAPLPPALEIPLKQKAAPLIVGPPEEKRNGDPPEAGSPPTPPPATEQAATSNGENGDNPDVSTAGEAKKVMAGDLVPLEEVDVAPQTIKSVDAVYPARAQMFGAEGSITVNALISETGEVIDTGILKGMKDDMGLEKAAETAVRKWKFEPAQKDGVNVKVWKPIVVLFKVTK